MQRLVSLLWHYGYETQLRVVALYADEWYAPGITRALCFRTGVTPGYYCRLSTQAYEIRRFVHAYLIGPGQRNCAVVGQRCAVIRVSPPSPGCRA